MIKNQIIRLTILIFLGIILIFFWFYVYKLKHPASHEETSELQYLVDGHNARNALDYAGLYTGILPCADCEGIETWIELTYDSTFVKRTRYLGKGESTVFQSEGSFTWDDAGNTITLNGLEEANKYFVSENYMIHLDQEGKRITGDLAEMYILRKEMSGE